MKRLLFSMAVMLLAGCNLLMTGERPTPVIVVAPSITPASPLPAMPAQPPPTPLPGGLDDMLPIMSGICYEAARDAAERVFILRSTEDHIRLYDLADNSRLCQRPVKRYPFDFSQGEVLAGLWSRGTGCVARHDIIAYKRDDSAKSIRIMLDFVTEGDCPYELVRPFWVSIPNAQDYRITITIVE